MKLLLLLSVLLGTAPAFAQAPKDKAAQDKPAKEKSPAEVLAGVWLEITPVGHEYATFTTDGRLIMQRGGETMNLKYRVDAKTKPWKLDMDITLKGTSGTLYTVFEFPSPDEFRMAPPAADEKKRPDAEGLKNAKSLMKRITLAENEGIYQVLEVYLKKLAGTWEGKDGGETITLKLTADGTFTMKVADITDKGRFSINVKQSPLTMDLLSTEGTGARYSIFTLTPEGDLQVGPAGESPEERPKSFEGAHARTFKRKAEAPAKPK